MNNNLQITFFGGVGTVTGSNFLLENLETKILVDCGLLQGTSDALDENKKPFPYDPKSIHFLFITHAHMDHIGRVCKLVKDGFNGTIYSTPETKELSRLMLEDALKVMKENMSRGVLDTMLYENEDLDKTFFLWQTIPYHKLTQLGKDFKVNLLDAGHILGSAMYEFSYNPPSQSYGVAKKVVFTGDSGNSPSPLLRDSEKITDAHYLIVDSVYGDRNHEPKEERDERFKEIILDTIAKKGALIIPAFSIERTQVILYELNNLVEDGKIPSIPVYLDSPLGSKVTEVYKRFSNDFNPPVQKEIKDGDDIFNFPKLFVTHSSNESKEILNTANPKIIIAGSGMSSGGRVVGHEIHFLPDPKSTVLLMGYQAIGTLGRRIQNKPKEVEIPARTERGSARSGGNGTMVPIQARIEMISGYSSHKDSDHLVEMISDTAQTLKKIFVVMGEPKSSMFLAQRIRDELDLEAIYPEKGKPYLL